LEVTTVRFERRAGWAGIACIAFFAAGAVLGAISSSSSDDPAAIIARYTDGTKNVEAELSAFLMGFALLFFLPFVAGVRSLLRRGEDEPTGLPSVAFGAGILMASLLALVNVLTVAVPASEEFLDQYTVNPDVAQTFEVAGWWVLNYASLAGTVLVAATSLGARRAGAFPRWLTVAGYAVAVVGLFGLFTWGLSILLQMLWALVVSVVLVRGVTPQELVSRPAVGAA
jgi:hypothetical protein